MYLYLRVKKPFAFELGFFIHNLVASVVSNTKNRQRDNIVAVQSPISSRKKQKCRSVADSFALHLERGEAVTMIEAGGRFC